MNAYPKIQEGLKVLCSYWKGVHYMELEDRLYKCLYSGDINILSTIDLTSYENQNDKGLVKPMS